jgi:hypothetical protein
VVDPSAPWTGGVWAVETSGGSNLYYGVWGGHTAAVHYCLSQCARDFERVVLRSHDLFGFGVVHVSSRWGRGGEGVGAERGALGLILCA